MLLIPIGTRPEAIRLYPTVKALGDKCKVFWTNQNYSKNLSTDILEDPRFEGVFENRINAESNYPDHVSRYGALFLNIETITKELSNEYDKVLVLGDTDSALMSVLAAKKLGKKVYHMEAGNRCFDPQSPEEINRKMIDSISDVHLCYTKFAKQNLVSEGVPQNKIHVIGNPMAEFPEFFRKNENRGGYVLVTIHRAENEKYLKRIKKLLMHLQKTREVKLVLHPRYIDEFEEFSPMPSTNFSQFVEMEKGASLIITDSGTVCEEAAMLHKPCLIARKTTERPELMETGGTVLGNMDSLQDLKDACEYLLGITPDWKLPTEYEPSKVSQKVTAILQGQGNYV